MPRGLFEQGEGVRPVSLSQGPHHPREHVGIVALQQLAQVCDAGLAGQGPGGFELDLPGVVAGVKALEGGQGPTAADAVEVSGGGTADVGVLVVGPGERRPECAGIPGIARRG